MKLKIFLIPAAIGMASPLQAAAQIAITSVCLVCWKDLLIHYTPPGNRLEAISVGGTRMVWMSDGAVVTPALHGHLGA
jgi:hypothetical protein